VIAVLGLGPTAAPRPENQTDPCRADDQKRKASTTASTLPLVDLPEQAFAQEREQLDEHDAGVALVEIGPLRGMNRDSPEDLGQELLIAALVETWRF